MTVIEKGSLGILTGIVFFSIIASSSIGVVSDHWRANLPNKECILYGESKQLTEEEPYKLYGSPMSNCSYVTFSPVTFIIVSLLFAMYYVVRIKSSDLDIPVALMGILGGSIGMGILSLVQACMVSHGYSITCSAIRHISIKNNLFEVVNRTEEAVDNFLSAMDCRFHYNTLDYFYSNVTSGVDTDAAIRTALGTSWFIVILWFAFIGLTLTLFKKARGG